MKHAPLSSISQGAGKAAWRLLGHDRDLCVGNRGDQIGETIEGYGV
jgi:hypothetical protein